MTQVTLVFGAELFLNLWPLKLQARPSTSLWARDCCVVARSGGEGAFLHLCPVSCVLFGIILHQGKTEYSQKINEHLCLGVRLARGSCL